MSSWISEKDYRASHGNALGIGLNSAFIQEIKEDNVEFRALLEETFCQLIAAPALVKRDEVDPRNVICDLSRLVCQLRDELETYFALEEFFGGYELVENSDLNRQAEMLRKEHVDLFVQLDDICESVDKIVYREVPLNRLDPVIAEFKIFHQRLSDHETREMEIILKQSNQDLGGGD